MAAALLKSGWHLTEDGYRQCSDGGKLDRDQVIKSALNLDLKDIGASSLTEDFQKGRAEKLEGPVVLQISKLRNVSAPKARPESEGAPRLLRLWLTDGHVTCCGFEVEPLSSLSTDTAPGTKLLLKGTVSAKNGLLLLKNSNVQNLGGRVDRLFDAWQLDTAFSNLKRNVGRADGPPKFVAFGDGGKKSVIVPVGRPQGEFKSLASVAKPAKSNEAADEFLQLRELAIADVEETHAVVASTQLTFGGIKQAETDEPIAYAAHQHKPKKDKVTPAQAVKSLLYSDYDEDDSYRGRRGRGRGRRGGRGNDEDGHIGRPLQASTLFDFVASKIDDGGASKVVDGCAVAGQSNVACQQWPELDSGPGSRSCVEGSGRSSAYESRQSAWSEGSYDDGRHAPPQCGGGRGRGRGARRGGGRGQRYDRDNYDRQGGRGQHSPAGGGSGFQASEADFPTLGSTPDIDLRTSAAIRPTSGRPSEAAGSRRLRGDDRDAVGWDGQAAGAAAAADTGLAAVVGAVWRSEPSRQAAKPTAAGRSSASTEQQPRLKSAAASAPAQQQAPLWPAAGAALSSQQQYPVPFLGEQVLVCYPADGEYYLATVYRDRGRGSYEVRFENDHTEVIRSSDMRFLR